MSHKNTSQRNLCQSLKSAHFSHTQSCVISYAKDFLRILVAGVRTRKSLRSLQPPITQNNSWGINVRESRKFTVIAPLKLHSLKTLTSLFKEVRPFFLGDNSIWKFSLCFFPQRLQHLEVLKATLALRP